MLLCLLSSGRRSPVIAGIVPRDPQGRWGHDYVQASFGGELIKRRKLYPSTMSSVLPNHYDLSQVADYKPDAMTRKQADRALRRGQGFVRAIRRQGDLR